MELLADFGWLTLGLFLLYFGAEWLVRGAASLSLKLGLTPLVIGLTVVAFGTSAPELLVSLQANLEAPPKGGFALGNVIGSNICNLALILGIAALISPIKVHHQVIKKEAPLLVLVTLCFLWMLRDQRINFCEALVLTGSLVLYIIFSIKEGLKSGQEEQDIEGLDPTEINKAKNASSSQLIIYFLLVLTGIILLVLGAKFLIQGGVGIAEFFKVPDVLIALSLVALGTSLPELATSIVASMKKQGDIIVGNVVGSNLFNILAVVGITALISPLRSTELKTLDLWFMMGLALIALPMMWTRQQIGRVEGAIFLLIYIAYISLMFLGGNFHTPST